MIGETRHVEVLTVIAAMATTKADRSIVPATLSMGSLSRYGGSGAVLYWYRAAATTLHTLFAMDKNTNVLKASEGPAPPGFRGVGACMQG